MCNKIDFTPVGSKKRSNKNINSVTSVHLHSDTDSISYSSH